MPKQVKRRRLESSLLVGMRKADPPDIRLFPRLLGRPLAVACILAGTVLAVRPGNAYAQECQEEYDCVPPDSSQLSDFEEAVQMIQFNEDDCTGDMANLASSGLGHFNALVNADRVGIYEEYPPAAFYDEDEDWIGLTDDHWDQPNPLGQLANSMVHEGLHRHGAEHSTIEQVVQSCILW